MGNAKEIKIKRFWVVFGVVLGDIALGPVLGLGLNQIRSRLGVVIEDLGGRDVAEQQHQRHHDACAVFAVDAVHHERKVAWVGDERQRFLDFVAAVKGDHSVEPGHANVPDRRFGEITLAMRAEQRRDRGPDAEGRDDADAAAAGDEVQGDAFGVSRDADGGVLVATEVEHGLDLRQVEELA